jgi:hypothetical protein
LKIYKSIYICVLIALIISGCREPFNPGIDKYENILVIDGLITDQEGPHMVRLSRSYSFDENYPDPEENAVVTILDEDQNSFLFTEDSPGKYLSSPGLKGLLGKSYKLVVVTADDTYESDWVRLNRVPEIDSVTYTFEERPVTAPDQSLYGIQVRVNTHDEANDTRYYRWEWTETWEIITPIKSSLYPDEERCWKTTQSSLISIGTSEHLTNDVVEEQPLYFISAGTNKLRIRYSSLISQYSMSREAYSYWKSLQDITQNTGTLFDPTPAAVTGNMYCTDDPEKPVLGIFQASAVTQMRIFIDRGEIPAFLNIPSGYSFCSFYETADSVEIAYYAEHGFPFVDQYINGDTEFFLYSNSEACFRCTLAGSNMKPDFWPPD